MFLSVHLEGSCKAVPLGLNEYVYGGQLFRECYYNDGIVRLRFEDQWICFTSMAEAAGRSAQWIFQILSIVNPEFKESYHHKSLRKKGTLMEHSLASMYAKELGTLEQMQRLLATKYVYPFKWLKWPIR